MNLTNLPADRSLKLTIEAQVKALDHGRNMDWSRQVQTLFYAFFKSSSLPLNYTIEHD
jgi:hypothetical protein